MNSASIHTLISTPSYRTTIVNTLLQQVQAGNADGIVIDFEQPATAETMFTWLHSCRIIGNLQSRKPGLLCEYLMQL